MSFFTMANGTGRQLWHLPAPSRTPDRPRCRFCLCPIETTVHLLTNCPGTSPYRLNHGISLDTLYQDNPANILAISQFDDYISRTLHSTYIKIPYSQKAIGSAVKKAKRKKSKPTPGPKSNTASNEPGKHAQDSNKTGDQSRHCRFQTFGASPQPTKKRRSQQAN